MNAISTTRFENSSSRLLDRIRLCLNERQQRRTTKIYSIIHYIEHLQRSLEENPLIREVLLRFYHLIKTFTHSNNRFSSTLIFDGQTSKQSLDELSASSEQFYPVNSDLSHSMMSLSVSPSMELNNLPAIRSTLHFVQTTQPTRPSTGLLTKSTQNALEKLPRQRTRRDIEVLEHLLARCECLRRFPTGVRHYAARSLLLLKYQSNTILTRHHTPSFLVYMIVEGQCRLLLETQRTTLVGRTLNIGEIYGDDSLSSRVDHRLIGLMTSAEGSCCIIAFFSRDIRAYENYLSNLMKQSLLDQLHQQSTFAAIQWRTDLVQYFLKWSTYQQFKKDEVIYGNEPGEHESLYFILHGQVSSVHLMEFPSLLLKNPQFHQKQTKKSVGFVQQPSVRFSSSSHWRFLEIFVLSQGHYFGFQSNTINSWYLCRSLVDTISISKKRFQSLGHFAPMIFDKLRQDFLDICRNESFIRNSFLKNLRIQRSMTDEISASSIGQKKKLFHIDQYESEFFNKFHWIPNQTDLNGEKEKIWLKENHFDSDEFC